MVVKNNTHDIEYDPNNWVDKHSIHPLALDITDDPISKQIKKYIKHRDVDMNDVLWLARATMSETKDLDEAYHIMWIIRNRVDSGYRNKHTYQDVILDPYQFSTFNPTEDEALLKRKRFYMNRNFDDDNYGNWHVILKMAAVVISLDDAWNPYDITTRHFVHQKALVSKPSWLKSKPDNKINTLSVYDGV